MKARLFIIALLLLAIVDTGCTTKRTTKPASPPGYELDTTPEMDGEGWL